MNQTAPNHYLVIDSNGQTRFVILPKDKLEADMLKPYTEVFTDLEGMQHAGLMLPKKKKSTAVSGSRWQSIEKRFMSSRKLQITAAAAGFLIFAGLGYMWHSTLKSNEPEPLPASYADTAPGTNRQHAGVDISQVYPFAEAENPAVAGKAVAVTTSTRSSAGLSSIPAIPRSQPRPNVPLPTIPSNPYVTANTAGPVNNTVSAKKGSEDSFQSKIAFIGGDGIPDSATR